MESTEIVAVIALILSVLLLFKVFSLQGKLSSMKADLEWLKNRPDASSGGLISNSTSPTTLPEAQNVADSDELDGRLRMMLASGQKIQAIKKLRETRNLSLLEAKQYVERLEQN